MTPVLTALVTRCPKCATAFRVSATQLQSAQGMVRCGSCLQVFNANKHEVDAPESTSQQTPAKALTPEVVTLQPAVEPVANALPSEQPIETSEAVNLTPPPTEVVASEQTNTLNFIPRFALVSPEEHTSAEEAKSNDNNDNLSESTSIEIDEEVSPPKEDEANEPSYPIAEEYLPEEHPQHQDESINDAPHAAAFPDEEIEEEIDAFFGDEENDTKSSAASSLFERVPESEKTIESDEDESWAEQLLAEEALEETQKTPSNLRHRDEQESFDLEQHNQAEFFSHDAPKDASSEDFPETTPEDSLHNFSNSDDGFLVDDNAEIGHSEILNFDEPPIHKDKTYTALISENELVNTTSPSDTERLLEETFNPLTQITAEKTKAPISATGLLPDHIAEMGSSKRQVNTTPKRHRENSRDSMINAIESAPVVFSTHHESHFWTNFGWLSASVLALLILAGQYVYLHWDRYALNNQYRPLLTQVCEIVGCQLPILVDIKAIDAVNLVVRAHPDFSNVLMVDAKILNRAAFAQPFPKLLLVFSDLNDNQVASRLFGPEEYLRGELAGQSTIPSQQPVQISLDIVDPGENAVNYHLLISE